jgi:hypothetical protein
MGLAISIAALLGCASFADAAPPANDSFASASALSPVPPSSASGSNVEASKEAGEPNHAGDPGGHSVWFSWTPSSSGPIGVRSGGCFSGIDTLIGVYTGASVDALTPVASNEIPMPPSCFFSETPVAEFDAAAGTTYWIAVDGRDGAQGSFELQFSLPPANDDFAAAQPLGAEPPQSVFGSTRLADKETGEPNHAGDPGGHSVWFSWAPSSSGPVDISTCSPFSSLDPVLAVYTGSGVNALTQIAGNDDGASPGVFPECSWTDSEVHLDAAAGTTYRIAIDGASGTVGRFNLRIRGRPENDDFAAAQAVGASLPTSVYQATNRLATKETGEPNHAGDPGDHSVWFSWTPAASGPVAIDACPGFESGIDTVLAVYTGSSVGALTPVASNDDHATEHCTSGSEVRFNATEGTTYRIAVDGKGSSEGRFSMSFEGPPANDGFASAQAIPAPLPTGGFGSIKLATKETGEPNHAGDPGGHSVWFSWTPSSSGPVDLRLCSYFESPTHLVAAVYTGSSLGALTPVASAEGLGPGCGANAGETEFAAAAGTTYRIAVDGKGGGEGRFDLQITGPPENDDFAAADVLPPAPMTAGGSTRFASKEPGEPNHAGNPGGHSLWFSWTPSSSGPVDITACSSDGTVDTLLAVYTGSAVNTLTPVASNDDASAKPPHELCESTDGSSEVEFNATEGTTYRIAVDGKDGDRGHVSLAFERAPGNDAFATPRALDAGLPSFAGDVTKLATKEVGEPNHAGDPGGHSLWYSWTPASSGPVAISTCTYYGGLDALLAVYAGSGLGSLTPVASNDDGASSDCRASDSEALFTATAGTTYRIAVDGKAGSSGGFQLRVEGRPANDDFGKPQPLGGAVSPRWVASNRLATKQIGEPDHAGDSGGASLWFKWTAPHSGPVSVDTCDSGLDTLLAVYTGTSFGALTPVQSNDDASGKCSPRSKLSFEAVANTVYRIAVDGKGGAQGSVDLRIDLRPRNDDFSAAQAIPGPVGWYAPGSTLLAGKETGEPNHAGDPGGHSVWFSWTPSKDVAVELDGCTISFDPLLAVYTGTAVDDLTAVASSDAGTGECEEGRSIGFHAVGGTTYRIAVDGVGGDDGHFTLQMRAVAVPLRQLTVSKGGSGAGTIASTLAGISCGSTCSRRFEKGTSIALTATPEGSTFLGWSGGGCSGTGPCQVTLNADTAVTATFQATSGGSGGNAGGGSGGSGGGGNKPPLKCKPGFKKVKVKGKQKCVKKKKPGKHKGGGKGKGRAHER